MLLTVLLCTASVAADHTAVRDTIVSAMNDFSTAPAKFLALLDDDAEWCDPYPDCQRGKANITAFLTSMPKGTDTILLAEPMVVQDTVGGMMTTLSFSWPGAAASCLYTADQHVSWNLSSTVPGAKPKLNYVRWVYNASEFDTAIGSCLGSESTRGVGIGDRGREADLQAVKDFVVSIQYNLAAQAKICDLLLPTARYCDPYPKDCAIGRKGCREMKGLPPDSKHNASAVVTPKGKQYQCRPGSVRPLLPSGPTTGALYIAYSSASRALGRVSHKLHHTYAIWDLAPANSSSPHQPPGVPMIAGFDWFMPDHNV